MNTENGEVSVYRKIMQFTYVLGFIVILISLFFPYHVGQNGSGSFSLGHINDLVPWYYYFLTVMVLLGLPALQFKILDRQDYVIRDVLLITVLVIALLTERAWLPQVSELKNLEVPLGLFLFHMGVAIQWMAIIVTAYENPPKLRIPESIL